MSSLFFWNDTGYLEGAVFEAVLAKEAEEWSTHNSGMPALLFGDQLAAHRRADSAECAMTFKLFLFSLAPSISHFTQFLDETPLGALQVGKTRRNEVAVMDAVLTNTSSRDTLLLAAYAAERQVFTRPVIQASFGRRGLWRFNSDMMKANVRANRRMVETGETAVEAARTAASQVIRAAQERVDVTRAGAQSGRAAAKKGVLHSPFLLLDQHRKLVEKAAKEALAKAARHADKEQRKISKERSAAHREAARERHRCRRCTNSVCNGGKTWTGCPRDEFWVCSDCSKMPGGRGGLEEHTSICSGAPAAPPESESDSGEETSGSVHSE